ncbi:hypothetical protein V495_02670 [Pseudogymnoascus sp. VKM F-4514 (FW-929)]|nr:hypothetical protein V495_02670 [Pseudogymnoascus sp. VKM F-4514 (FW-929)]KFY54616.1 hypothetical protein V497_07573 [Pseudogymnoascus sp. VKM F-4516 (FW-969)]
MADSTVPAERESYTCGICDKKFDRRDLRNRHKRRCIRSISNPRKSKQKSCYSCAASKLSCDMRLPSCSRCTGRKICCEYASTTGSQSEKAVVGDSENQSDTSDHATSALEYTSANENEVRNRSHPSLHNHIPVDNVQAEIKLLTRDQTVENTVMSSLRPPHSELGDPPIRDESTHSGITQSSDMSSSPTTKNELNRTWINVDNFDTDLEIAMAETDTMELTPGYQLSNSQSPFQFSDTTSLLEGLSSQWMNAGLANFQSPSENDWANSVANFSIEPPSDFNFNLMERLGMPGSHPAANALQRIATGGQVSNFDGLSWKPPLRPETNEYVNKVYEDELSMGVLNRPSRNPPVDTINISNDTRDRNAQVFKVDKGNELESYPVNGTSYQLDSNKDLTKILLRFPQIMARPGGKYPPFVHHRLYRCEEGDVLKPLAIAFCSVAALNAAFPSGKGFVHSLMNAERDQLLKGFRLLRDSELEMLATVHAICVYQIMGFFDDSSPDSARLAELQQPFLLRMARRLVASYMPQLRSSYDTSDSSELVWEKWIATETVRRTFFLIHIINVVACRMEKQSAYFYEELDDNLVMNLPLPAPEKIWKATSAAEWKSALEEELQSGWQANRTAAMNISENGWEESGVNGGERDLRGEDMLSDGRAAGGSFLEIHLANSHEFTRLLMHCVNKNRG